MWNATEMNVLLPFYFTSATGVTPARASDVFVTNAAVFNCCCSSASSADQKLIANCAAMKINNSRVTIAGAWIFQVCKRR